MNKNGTSNDVPHNLKLKPSNIGTLNDSILRTLIKEVNVIGIGDNRHVQIILIFRFTCFHLFDSFERQSLSQIKDKA